jgi:hypothetical protein
VRVDVVGHDGEAVLVAELLAKTVE